MSKCNTVAQQNAVVVKSIVLHKKNIDRTNEEWIPEVHFLICNRKNLERNISGQSIAHMGTYSNPYSSFSDVDKCISVVCHYVLQEKEARKDKQFNPNYYKVNWSYRSLHQVLQFS